uniref:Uncharacterized protein n=1 Tax=Rhizophora mucronata TaxID=61149 RepID=A0A2P2NQM8_RHIMU
MEVQHIWKCHGSRNQQRIILKKDNEIQKHCNSLIFPKFSHLKNSVLPLVLCSWLILSCTHRD